MLVVKRSAGVAQDINPRIFLHTGYEAWSTLALKAWQDTTRIQNIEIRGPTKETNLRKTISGYHA